MNAVGNYFLSNRYKSVAIISLFNILLSPLSYILSAVPLGLITLRKGGENGFYFLIATMIVTAVFEYISNVGFGLSVIFAISIWLPVSLIAMVLRSTESQGIAVLVAGSIGIVIIIVMIPFNVELSNWWQTSVNTFIEYNFTTTDGQQIQDTLDQVGPLLSGSISAMVLMIIISTTMLARYWQSVLFNPGGFAGEVHNLLLPKWLSLGTLVCVIISYIEIGELSWLAGNFLVVLIVLHVFQGIASVHRIVSIRKLSVNLLILMYFLLLIVPQIIALIGMADVLYRGKKSIDPG
jgi:hypothetical protein